MKAPAFQFYAQDFLTGCTYLTNEEIGMYVKMLCKQWTDGNIPKKRLGFLIGFEWDKLSEELQGKFQDFGEYVINERLEIEREKKQNFIEKQAKNGKKGGRPKKNETSEPSINKGEETQEKPKPLKNKNPNKNQKKPLENEDRSMKYEEEKEKENVNEKKAAVQKIEKVDIIFPFDSENFKANWQLWKTYKNKEHGFKFKSPISEQGSLKNLSELAENNEKTAILIIHQSIENGWKGFFELKNKSNVRNNNTSATDSDHRQSAVSEVGKLFGKQ